MHLLGCIQCERAEVQGTWYDKSVDWILASDGAWSSPFLSALRARQLMPLPLSQQADTVPEWTGTIITSYQHERFLGLTRRHFSSTSCQPSHFMWYKCSRVVPSTRTEVCKLHKGLHSTGTVCKTIEVLSITAAKSSSPDKCGRRTFLIAYLSLV
jgi:hypothetical protein